MKKYMKPAVEEIALYTEQNLLDGSNQTRILPNVIEYDENDPSTMAEEYD